MFLPFKQNVFSNREINTPIHTPIKNKIPKHQYFRQLGIKVVGSKGFEPMTSALSKQRSKPTELRSRFVDANIENPLRVHNPWKIFA
jgi:hypothetical protein